MKLAISNIGWHASEEAAVRSEMVARGVRGVEIAPTKVWANPLAADAREIASYRKSWEAVGIQVVALQSLLFGKPELTIFGAPAARQATLEYLQGMIRLARALGAHVLVFGSPRNRSVGQASREEIEAIATDFFCRVSQAAYEAGVCFCLEPNPRTYGCDFITTAAEGLWWVRRIDHPGLGLHLDTGCLTLSQDPVQTAITSASPVLRHFHLSEPGLNEVGSGDVPHELMAKTLASSGFDHWRSIEMRPPEAGSSLPGVTRALEFARTTYA